VEQNDHNFGTALGQGNTLAFVAGTLRIDVDAADLPAEYRKGLFSENAGHRVVVRFSDFGADGGVNVARMAVKVDGIRLCLFLLLFQVRTDFSIFYFSNLFEVFSNFSKTIFWMTHTNREDYTIFWKIQQYESAKSQEINLSI